MNGASELHNDRCRTSPPSVARWHSGGVHPLVMVTSLSEGFLNARHLLQRAVVWCVSILLETTLVKITELFAVFRGFFLTSFLAADNMNKARSERNSCAFVQHEDT